MSDNDHPLLFEGEYIDSTGAFSYETLLMRDCPKQFRDRRSAWNKYATQAVRNGVIDYSTWEWKSPYSSVQDKQGRCVSNFLRSCRVLKNPTEKMLANRAAVLAWMVSECVTKPPKYQRPQRGPRK